MIIKRTKKNIPPNQPAEERPKTSGNPEPQPVIRQEIPPIDEAIQLVQERQERRRGDRRRGYRRIDDRNLISRAHEEANSIREMASREGFEYGLNQAREDLDKLNSAISEFLSAKEQMIDQLAPEIAEIAVKVAEKVIKTEVACDETIVLNIVSEVLKQVGKAENNIIIKTNPADAEIVRSNIPKIFPYGGGQVRINVIEDNDVDWGSCIVETNNGMIDAKFSTQLQIIKSAFSIGL